MKSKKLISFLCAAALTASSFAGLAVTASAATTEDIQWSDTFNSYDLPDDSYGTWLQHRLVSGEGKGGKTYTGIDGVVLYTGGATNGDDSTYWRLDSDTSGDNYLVTSTGRFTTVDRGAKLLFGSLDDNDKLVATPYTATAQKDVVMNFKVKGIGAWEKANTYDNAFTVIDSAGSTETLFDMTTLNLDLDTWYNVKVVTTTSGTSIYVGDSTTPVATSAATSIAGLKFNAYIKGALAAQGSEYRNSGEAGANTIAGNGMGYPSYNFDDIVVFSADAGTGATTEVPPAQTHGAAVVTYETVPAGEAPSGLGLVASDNFNSKTSERLVFINTTEADSTYTNLDSVNIFCGTDSSTHSETKWSITQNAKTDPSIGTEKYLEAVSSVKSAANRGPKFYFKRDGAILEVAERETVVAQFAAKLHNNGDQPAEILFSGDLVASNDKGNINSPLALITTDADAASAAYAASNPIEKNGANVVEVANNAWVLVEIEAFRSQGKTAGAKIKVTTYTDGQANEPVYILGSASSYGDIKNSEKSGVNNLPYVSFRSGNSTDYYGEGSGSDTKNDIDNIAIYSTTVDPAATPTPSPTPSPTPQPKHDVTITNEGETVSVETTESTAFNAVLIHAKYDGTKLTKAKAYNLTGISSAAAKTQVVTDTVNEGDKFFVWESLASQIPYGSANATGPAAPTPTPDAATPTPDAATPTPDAATPTPDAATPTPDAATPTPDAATPTPDAATPTPAPTYTASISNSTKVNIAKKPAEGEAEYGTTDVTGLNAADVVAIKSDSDDKTLVSVKYTVGDSEEEQTANATNGVAEITVASGDIAIVSATFTYNSVAIKADANVASVTLGTTTIEKKDATAPSGEETNYTYTFTNVAEGKNALSATYAEGYEADSAVTTPVTIPLAADITITSKASEYEITYELNGGTNADDAPAKYTYGVGATLPTNPTKQYKTFGGWYAAADFTGDAVTTIANDATDAKTFYAKWNDITYTIADGNVENATVTLPDPATGVIGDEVEITVVAAADHAISKVEIKKGDNVVVEATKGANNKYTFTVADTEVTAVTVVPTVITAASESDEIAKVVVSPATATVTQGTNDTAFSAEVQNASNAPFLGDKGQVTWSVAAADSEKTKKDGTRISETGVLTVAADEEEALTITATSKTNGEKVGTATVTVKQTVAEDATVLTLAKTNGDKIAGASVEAVAGDYALSAVTPGVLKLTGETDKDGQVELLLNPNRKYTIVATLEGETLKTVENFTTASNKAIEIPSVTVATDASDAVKTLLANKVPGETATVTAEDGKTFYSVEVKDNSADKAAVTTDPTGDAIVGKTSVSFKVPDEGISAINVVYQQASTANIAIPAASTSLFGKTVTELGEFTIAESETEGIDYAITGTSNFVKGYTDFSSNVAEQKGNYVPIAVTFTIPSGLAAKTVLKQWSDANTTPRVHNDFEEDEDLDGKYVVVILDQNTATTKVYFEVDYDGDENAYTATQYVIDVTGGEGKLVRAAEQFTVTVPTAPVTGGTVTVDKSTAAATDTVTITLTAAEGYHLVENSVKANDGEVKVTKTATQGEGDPASDSTTYTFQMPAGNVSVEAVFEENQVRYGSVSYIGTDNVEGGDGTAAINLSEPFYANYTSLTSFVPGNAKWNSAATLIKVNAADLITDDDGSISTTLDSAVLTFHTECTESGSNSALAILRITGDLEGAAFDDLTFETLKDKSVVQVWDCANVGTTGADEEADLTSDLRKAGGSAIYAIVTKTGRQQKITNLNFTLTEADAPIVTAAATIQKVYADESGAITIDGSKYTAFGEAENVAASTDYFVGDSYTPAATYKNAIDDTENKTSRYEYVSGADATELAAATNDIYVIYNKIDYVATAFKVTLPEAAGEGGETVNVKLTGTPTSTGTPAAAAVDTDVAVTVAEGQTVGTATYKLLPGSYTFSYPEDATYVGVEEKTVDVSDTEGTANAITLTKNANTPTKITVKYVDADKESTDEGYLVKSEEITSQVYVGESYTIDNSYTDDFDTSDDGIPYKKYTYQADGSDSLTVANPAATNNDVIIKVKTDGKNYYYEDNFDDADPTDDWTVVKNSKDNVKLFYGEDNATTNQKTTGKIFGVCGNGNGDQSITSKAFGITSGKAYVSLDLRMDGCTSGKSSNFSLIGGNHSAAYLNSSQQILTIKAESSGNTYWSAITINGNDIYAKAYKNGEAGLSNVGRGSTGWLHLDAVIDLDARTQDITLTRISDDSEVYKATGVPFVNPDTVDGDNTTKVVTGLNHIVAAAGKSYGGIVLDDIQVYTKDSDSVQVGD